MTDTSLPEGHERVAATMAAAVQQDRDIVDHLPITVCRTVGEAETLVKYLAAAIKALSHVERDALLFSMYLNSLVVGGKVTVTGDVLQAALSRRVKVPEADHDDD